VVEKSGVLDRLITPIINAAKSVGALVISVVSAVLATNIVTADRYMAVVLPARSFKKPFAERGLAPVVLSRAVGPLEPTSPRSVTCPTVSNFASPLLTIALAYAGVRMCTAQQRNSRLGGVSALREPVLNSARHAPVVARSDLGKLIEQVDGLLRHGRQRASPCSWLRFYDSACHSTRHGPVAIGVTCRVPPATYESAGYRSADAFRRDDANIDVCASSHLPSYSLT